MAVTESLLNYRESALPQLRATDQIPGFEGDYPETYVRQYQATIQLQIEGPVSEILDRSRLFGKFTGMLNIQELPPFLEFIEIQDGVYFTYNDLNPTIPDGCVTTLSEVIMSSSLQEFGKAVLVISIDAFCPPEWYDAPAAIWRQMQMDEI